MNTHTRSVLLSCAAALALLLHPFPLRAREAAAAYATAPAIPAAPATPATPASPAAPAIPTSPDGANAAGDTAVDTGANAADSADGIEVGGDEQHEQVAIGYDARLPRDQQADTVVSVFGSSTAEGTVARDVVSVLGDTRMTGTAGGSAVAVLGDVYVDGEVDRDVVAVLGDISLGPNARVHGQVVEVFGTLHRDPAAVVRGGTHYVLPGELIAPGLHHWFRGALLMGRPLGLGLGFEWAWGVALTFLLLYLLVAALFRDAVEHCVNVLEAHPGRAVLSGVLAMLILPLLAFVLLVSIIGIPVLPLLACALFAAGVLGKTVSLAWIGNRCVGLAHGARPHPALTVLLGAVIATAAYLVPVLGFVVFALLGIVGLGAVLYAVIGRRRAAGNGGTPRAAAAGFTTAGPAGPAGAAGATPADSAAPQSSAPGANAQESPRPDAGAAAAAPGPSAAGAAGPAAGAAPAVPLYTLPRAGFWIRMLALLIDLVIVAVALDSLLGWHHDAATRAQLVAAAAYGAVMWKLRSSTIGGMVCDLRVVRLDGKEMDWPTAIVRGLGCLLSAAVIGLGFLWIAFDEGRQAWHDKLAGTVVVQVPKAGPQP